MRSRVLRAFPSSPPSRRLRSRNCLHTPPVPSPCFPRAPPRSCPPAADRRSGEATPAEIR
ncbi:hypothetical protein P280DRAFT_471194 [Massarina eburnea CBS 473.64]|uniref:Uncharacterized protein n=1 Tax=Massarina eburnea CBS 473.64 TaxID=1395130 RepID=A0A6A6RWM0_9PLEO|nr:hypothetical protein P280DRAFT_471194 [Massarina eburnea CBS 473.64]